MLREIDFIDAVLRAGIYAAGLKVARCTDPSHLSVSLCLLTTGAPSGRVRFDGAFRQRQ